jgi:DNA repair exonuclease SbcCD ATPase subunit
MKIAHFADVHFRGLARHDEYRAAFNDAFKKLAILKPDVIYVGGDIVHSKTQGITPELIDILSWWFTKLSEICPVDVILGNHDGLLLNKDRQDAVTPIISALNNPRIRLFKKSGVYDTPVAGYKWCVFSPFDTDGWEFVKPDTSSINIALYHGAVRGSKSDSDFALEGEVTLDMFEKFDFGMFGDIHKRQFLNDAETIGYCGSTIQQNYGEDLEKGFLFWDIKTRNKFTAKFVQVQNDFPFVNIDWAGDVVSTISKLSHLPDRSRIRFNLPSEVSEVDSRSLHDMASRLKNFSEVVFKIEAKTEKKDEIIVTQFKSSNLRDRDSIKNVIETYLKERAVEDSKITAAIKEFDKYFDAVTFDDDVARNVMWSLKKIEFDNIFAYGKDNVINFDNLQGITGIFGKNRAGKSSIIGTIVWNLFNTSDRGSMKNLHIINTDEETCRSKINLSVSGEDYELTRDSMKNYPKRGEVWANTTLSLKKKSTGDVMQDLNDEQRRETEKIVRKLIGTADDFFYTCLAPQGQMNMFINEKSTSRKQILSRFLDLDIFDKYLEVVKQDISPLKVSIKTTSSIESLNQTLTTLKEEKVKLEDKAIEAREELSRNRTKLTKISSSENEHIVSENEVHEISAKIEKLRIDIKNIEDNLDNFRESIKSFDEKIVKIKDVREVFSIDELQKQQDAIADLEMKYAINFKDLESKEKELESLRRSIEILNTVPCGDSFPSCVFIKDAHQSKKVLEIEESTRTTIQRTLYVLREKLSSTSKEEIKGKIDKINKLSSLEKDLENKRVQAQSQISIYEERLSSKERFLQQYLVEHKSLASKLKEQSASGASDKHRELVDLKKLISVLEEQVITIASTLGRISERIATTEAQISTLKGNLERFETLTLLENAFSKKGIPQNIITKNLPLINSEIAKILSGIAGFTVEIECDDSSSIEIYINYGDRKRIIELGSGMEKMISSIAIRVALTNISSLPKSDMLIIDEGFGVLDESNLEACARLLQNLKNYFRKILIISHVDAIKDIVDNVLSIDSSTGKARVTHE